MQLLAGHSRARAAASAAATAPPPLRPLAALLRRLPLSPLPRSGGSSGSSSNLAHVRGRAVVAHSGGYSFADTGDRREPGERRNRTIEKRANAELTDVVRGLVGMSPKQLAAVAHLLSAEQLAEIALAARLPRVNQGRKRHENRVSQLIRAETSEDAIFKLREAVQLAQASAALFIDTDAGARVEAWVEGLRAGDPAVLQEVGGLLAGELDMQQLRQLAAQMAKDAAAATSGGGSGGGGGGGSGAGGGGGGGMEVSEAALSDPALMAILTAKGGKGKRGGGGGGGTAPMGAAERRARARCCGWSHSRRSARPRWSEARARRRGRRAAVG
ncbi:MAG: hypothetical protein J3K34DRAFT_69665 [Monoraphidium minutum]|nr:MAG: hypothetical protein J3K34DRAFT_69665 [Monoraphidium minutum]